MLPSTFPQSTNQSSSLNPRLLESRTQYRSCHIRLPGDSHRTAAIVVEGKYYSLVKVTQTRQQTLEICRRLIVKGHQILITKIAKGYAIWVFEPDAIPQTPPRSSTSPVHKPIASPTCRILSDRSRYLMCQIRVPDLDEHLEAIQVDGRYYGLFKVAETRQQALEFAVKLGRRGDETIITRTPEGDAIWVLEADAQSVG
ncbi:hypothetical protein J5X98_01165 [Leptothermofonsia sichuanensis E412]|uniref:hypothetical protein n=1 Tax=Leptothermofonsia sichuanensis TaxID=2917832 RepID=UPI001CA763F5|nr:hypothetical protein [Leptothermofonsia sichuanensis]QZZ21147.1 hypothetical protein J5X98_01165 [Leptothermofonsia sichuanensis E412]